MAFSTPRTGSKPDVNPRRRRLTEVSSLTYRLSDSRVTAVLTDRAVGVPNRGESTTGCDVLKLVLMVEFNNSIYYYLMVNYYKVPQNKERYFIHHLVTLPFIKTYIG